MSGDITCTVTDAIAWITIDRPDVRNALDSRVFAELTALVQSCGANRDIRCVIITGGGERVFISGADIREFREKLATPELAIAYDAEAERLNEAVGAIPQPVIAMLNGHAIGSGCLLAIACDFRVAAETAKLGIPVAKIGICIGPPDLLRLAQLVGVARAKRLLMTGELLDARQALVDGLVDKVAAPGALRDETLALAHALIANAPLSLKATKEMAARFLRPAITVQDGAPWYVETYGSADLTEGIDALLAKRKPAFTGR